MIKNSWIGLAVVVLVVAGGMWGMRSRSVTPNAAVPNAALPDVPSAAPADSSAAASPAAASRTPIVVALDDSPKTDAGPHQAAAPEKTSLLESLRPLTPPSTFTMPRVGPHDYAPSPSALPPSMSGGTSTMPSAIGYGGPGVGTGGRGVFNVPK